MKQSGDQHGESGTPRPGARGGGSRRRSLDDVVIVPLDPNFDIDSEFQSEPQPVEAAAPVTEVRAADAPAAERPATEAAVTQADNLVRFESEPAASGRSRGPALSIADLLDNHVRLEWQEVVAIAQHLCQVMARDPAASVHKSLVEPWNVEITDAGEVQVLPGGSSSDPLVKQVGRVLRALLQDSVAPPELRLVASQASFDVPVYSGVDELSAALRHFERPGNSSAIRAAFSRGLEAKLSGIPPVPPAVRAAAVVRPAIDRNEPVKPKPASFQSPVRRRSRSSKIFKILLMASAAAAALFLIAGAAELVSGVVRTLEQLPVLRARTAVMPGPTVKPRGTPDGKSPNPPVMNPPPVVQSATRAITSLASAVASAVPGISSNPPAGPAAAAPAVTSAANTVGAAVPGRSVRPPAPQAPSRHATPEPRRTTPAPSPAGSVGANTPQAAGLLAPGRADDAAMFFDSIVLKNPLYRPDSARLSPEALSAFRNSKRTILTAMVRSHYQDGRAALDAGDFSLAISEAERARALLKDLDELDINVEAGEVVADLRTLLTLASAARTAEEEKVYTIEDSSVIPPLPLGRQLSAASMSRMSLRPTGHLEILVGRSGRVEAVKLDTPMNGYHDRMLVSAVKAWHYKPAVKNGRPVRFSLMVTMRLPDL